MLNGVCDVMCGVLRWVGASGTVGGWELGGDCGWRLWVGGSGTRWVTVCMGGGATPE